MMYKEECVIFHTLTMCYLEKSYSNMMFTESATVIDFCDCLPPPAVLYSLPIFNPTTPTCSLSLTTI